MSGVGRPITVPQPEEIPPDCPPELRKWLERLMAALDVREGRTAAGKNARFVTIQDLVDAGLINDGDIR